MILLDIGNTHTRIAEAVNGRIRLKRILNTCDLAPGLLPESDEIFALSVVPEAEKKLPGVHFLRAADCAGVLDLSLADSSTLGVDRIANAAAAAATMELPALVLDCGSAITIELVDEHKRFAGGAIAPGRLLLRKALHCGTAQLPEIPLSCKIPTLPGLCTVDALLLGIDRGAVGAVRELVESCELCMGPCHKAVTGGDREFFASALKLPMAPDDFTLRGAALMAEHAKR